MQNSLKHFSHTSAKFISHDRRVLPKCFFSAKEAVVGKLGIGFKWHNGHWKDFTSASHKVGVCMSSKYRCENGRHIDALRSASFGIRIVVDNQWNRNRRSDKNTILCLIITVYRQRTMTTTKTSRTISITTTNVLIWYIFSDIILTLCFQRKISTIDLSK